MPVARGLCVGEGGRKTGGVKIRTGRTSRGVGGRPHAHASPPPTPAPSPSAVVKKLRTLPQCVMSQIDGPALPVPTLSHLAPSLAPLADAPASLPLSAGMVVACVRVCVQRGRARSQRRARARVLGGRSVGFVGVCLTVSLLFAVSVCQTLATPLSPPFTAPQQCSVPPGVRAPRPPAPPPLPASAPRAVRPSRSRLPRLAVPPSWSTRARAR